MKKILLIGADLISVNQKICPDGIGELADIVFGDAWEEKDGYPDFDDKLGQSFIIARTEVGRSILEEAISEKYLTVSPFSAEKLHAVQPSQRKRRQAILPRLLALRLMGKPIPTYQGFYLLRNAISGGAFAFFRQFLGMLDRLYKEK